MNESTRIERQQSSTQARTHEQADKISCDKSCDKVTTLRTLEVQQQQDTSNINRNCTATYDDNM